MLSHLLNHAEANQEIPHLFRPLTTKYKEDRFVIDEFIREGSLTILAGDPKCGKSSFATGIAMAVAAGKPFASRTTHQGAVLWVAGEEDIRERMNVIYESPAFDESLPIFTCFDQLDIDTEEGLDSIQKWMRQTEAKLLVIDSLHACITGRSLSDGRAARKSLMPLKKFCGFYELACIVIHHSSGRKGEARVAESSQLAATASQFWLFTSRRSENREGRTITVASRGRGDYANQTHRFHSPNPTTYEATADREWTLPVPYQSVWFWSCLAAFATKGDLNVYEVQALHGHAEGTVRNSFSRLKNLGYIEKVGTRDEAATYRATPEGIAAVCRYEDEVEYQRLQREAEAAEREKAEKEKSAVFTT